MIRISSRDAFKVSVLSLLPFLAYFQTWPIAFVSAVGIVALAAGEYFERFKDDEMKSIRAEILKLRESVEHMKIKVIRG